MKLPQTDFDLEKYRQRRKETDEKYAKGEITFGEKMSLNFFRKEEKEINKHFRAIEKIVEESNIPMTFDYCFYNAQVANWLMEEATIKAAKDGETV